MDVAAFATNWRAAKALCPSLGDRLKYLFWIYDIPRRTRSVRTQPLTISFDLPAPVGVVTLRVRANAGSDAFIFSEVLQHRYYDFELPEAPSTILDLGANVGFTAIFLARKYPQARLAVVEPIPANVEMLSANLERNGVQAEIIAKAIAIQDGVVKMQMAANDYGHKVSGISFGRSLAGADYEVAAVSVPSLLAQLGWDRIGLLKIDIEGYEGVLLRHSCAWLDQVDNISVECHEGFNDRDLQAVATKHGFSRTRWMGGAWLLTRTD